MWRLQFCEGNNGDLDGQYIRMNSYHAQHRSNYGDSADVDVGRVTHCKQLQPFRLGIPTEPTDLKKKYYIEEDIRDSLERVSIIVSLVWFEHFLTLWPQYSLKLYQSLRQNSFESKDKTVQVWHVSPTRNIYWCWTSSVGHIVRFAEPIFPLYKFLYL